MLYSENSSNTFRRLRRRGASPANRGSAAFGACPVVNAKRSTSGFQVFPAPRSETKFLLLGFGGKFLKIMEGF
jgi:hypothetical protein